jgi:hypothetical protein
MRAVEFVLLFNDHSALFLTLWAAIFVLYRLLFWRTVKSIFDPLYFWIIFTNSICTTDVVFLSVLGEIRDYYTLTYLLSECALISGILLFSRQQPILEPLPVSPLFVQRLRIGMVVTIVLFIGTTLMVYAERGIPLLLDSRAEASTGGSGFGFVTRISQVANVLFVLFYYAKSQVTGLPNSNVERLMLLMSILFNLLSGFKAFFLLYLFGYFITHGRNKASSWKRDFYVILAGTIAILGLFAVVFDTTEIDVIFLVLMSRLLSSGDVYFMAFPNNVIEQLPPQDFFFQLFGSLLASFRLISWDQAPLNYGYVINEFVNHNDFLFGPTFRYNVLWLLLTRSIVLTILLSFLVGMVVGYLNRMLNKRTHLNFNFILLSLVYYYSFVLILGPDAGINTIFMSLIITAFIYLVVLLPVPCKRSVMLSQL